ncbi:MAG: DUF3486 family protein [Chromatiales bacterium]|nr:DUF3486 family protein [Chromatiales bacterium]
MARPSTIEQLPPDILEQLQALLRDPRVSQMEATKEINTILENVGHPERVSKSAVNRYSMRMEQVGERLRQSRQVAQMWIAKLGAQPQGQVGHLVNEILRTLAFDLSMTMQQGEIDKEEAPEVAKMLKNMAIAMERLEKAASENVKREQEIKQQARKEAAEVAEKVAKQGGLSADSVQELRRAILGVKS